MPIDIDEKRRLEKLLGMLGSSFDGERANAMMAQEQFDPSFASPVQWAEMYRSFRIQAIPAKMPHPTKPWKMPAVPEWGIFQEELITDGGFARWYGPGGAHTQRRNIGVITGRASENLLCVDLDIHTKDQARLWWQALCSIHNYGDEPETWKQRTGGGGRQLFFRLPIGVVAPTNKTPIGADFRGQGGFAMLPPSLHSSGQEYEWESGFAPWEQGEPAMAPQWLIEGVDALVFEHGGHRPESRDGARTASPSSDFDAFFNRVDGREDAMAKAVWAAVLRMRRDGHQPGTPEEKEHFEAALKAYLAATRTRLKGVDNIEGLERENRGPSMFFAKWQRTVRRKWGTEYFEEEAAKPPPHQEEQATEPPPGEAPPPPDGIHATPFEYVDPSTIPPREWIYGQHYIRRFLSTTVAPGGVGKSSLAIVELLAIATGRPLLGREPAETCPVWYWNGEDPLEELIRRIMAACAHHKIRPEELKGRFFVNSGRITPIVIAERSRDGVLIHRPVIEQVIATIQANGIGAMSVDPFVASHRVTENDNMEIEKVAKSWSHIAEVTNAGMELVHHVRKMNGGEVTVEDGRGAVALLSAARSARAINRMTPEDALKAGIAEPNYYFRLDNGKANLAPPAAAQWFKMVGVDLHNETETRPSDKVGVTEAWDWPDHTSGVTGGDVELVQRLLRDPARKWRADHQSAEWVGFLIIEALGGNPKAATPQQIAQAKALQKLWTKSGAIREYDGKDGRYNRRKFVEAGE